MGKPVGIVENYKEITGTSWSMWEQLLGNHLEIAANIFGNHQEIVGKLMGNIGNHSARVESHG